MNDNKQHDLGLNNPNQKDSYDGPVECLGKTFTNDVERREYYLEILAEKLKDPEFRKIEGFPLGKDEDILTLSDPPYYTACPNPFLNDFIRQFGKPYDPKKKYKREPFAVDVSVGKTDALYKAHSYHTKVPHLAIVPSILHYTTPGDIVLDGFCGSGMTGIAAQWCGVAPQEYRTNLEAEWRSEGRSLPQWGERKAILNDLSPAATFIAANYNIPFDIEKFSQEGQRLLDEVSEELGWMYETMHTDGVSKGQIDYTVWSEVFSCPDCAGEVVFLDCALDVNTKKVRDEFNCLHCDKLLTKKLVERLYESKQDPLLNETWRHVKFVPVLICYRVGKKKFEKKPDDKDLMIINDVSKLSYPSEIPLNRFPIEDMYHGSRIEPKGFSHTHHFFLPRAAQSLALLWRKAKAVADDRTSKALLYMVEQALWTMSIMNRYRPTGFSQVNQYMTGVYYIASQVSECSPEYVLGGKFGRLTKVFSKNVFQGEGAFVNNSSAVSIPIDEQSVDYIFTDPPFGENIFYADLNVILESWHKVMTCSGPEAIVDRHKSKGMPEYQGLMQRCFEEYYRVLKPGRWMTVVFHNSKNSVWNAIQEAMQSAGFVVADVRTLDKQQGSYRQVTSSAVKQDLVISAYKANGGLEQRFGLIAGTEDGVWGFVDTHLKQVVVFDSNDGKSLSIAERLPHRLYDRMVGFHVRRGIRVPLSFASFYKGLSRYAERDGMYFLPDQVSEYDKKRLTVREVMQLEIAVSDEESAIQWVRQQLEKKPYRFSELQPMFMKERQGGWQKYEKEMELDSILKDNFLDFQGVSPIPVQVLSWLKKSDIKRDLISKALLLGSFEDGKGFHTKDKKLLSESKDRWFVPDPENAAQLLEKRNRLLLKEFEEYKKFDGKKLKEFRLEVVKAGFFKAWQDHDYKTIVSFSKKLPESVIQEDQKLLAWVDNSQTRLSDESLF